MAGRLYLDANAFIRLVEGRLAPEAPLIAVMRRVETGRAHAFTSELTLAEVLVDPYAEDDRSRVDAYLDVIQVSGVLRVLPVNRETLIRAARLRSCRKSLKLPDAIHVATAEMADCPHLLSSDQRILVSRETGMERVGLDDASLTRLLGLLA